MLPEIKTFSMETAIGLGYTFFWGYEKNLPKIKESNTYENFVRDGIDFVIAYDKKGSRHLMPTAEDFYEWMKEFHPGIHLVGFQRKIVDAYFNEGRWLVQPSSLLAGKTFLRNKFTEFEEDWRQKKYAKNI